MTHTFIKPLAVALLLGLLPLTISSAYAVVADPTIAIKGDKGDLGSKGDSGLKGDSGFKGDKGEARVGLIGPAGPPGIPGLKGDTGNTGAPGLKDDAGAHAVDGTVVGQTLIWNGSAWTPTASSCTPYHYGDIGPDGGKVFYVDGSGCHGLEAQVADASSGGTMSWSAAISAAAAYNITTITGISGLNCSTTEQTATPNCWHLPSKTELTQLCEQMAFVGGFQDVYWSSTDTINNYAWHHNFNYGTQGFSDKGITLPVRAVRAF